MKFVTSVVVPIIASSTIAKAALDHFQFSGELVATPDTKCSSWYLYYMIGEGAEVTGYFQVDDCLDHPVSVGDGTFTMDFDPDNKKFTLKELSSGEITEGRGGKGGGKCDGTKCPLGDTVTCFYGIAPSSTAFRPAHCKILFH